MDIDENEKLLAIQFRNEYIELYNEWLENQILIQHEESLADTHINLQKNK